MKISFSVPTVKYHIDYEILAVLVVTYNTRVMTAVLRHDGGKHDRIGPDKCLPIARGERNPVLQPGDGEGGCVHCRCAI